MTKKVHISRFFAQNSYPVGTKNNAYFINDEKCNSVLKTKDNRIFKIDFEEKANSDHLKSFTNEKQQKCFGISVEISEVSNVLDKKLTNLKKDRTKCKKRAGRAVHKTSSERQLVVAELKKNNNHLHVDIKNKTVKGRFAVEKAKFEIHDCKNLKFEVKTETLHDTNEELKTESKYMAKSLLDKYDSFKPFIEEDHRRIKKIVIQENKYNPIPLILKYTNASTCLKKEEFVKYEYKLKNDEVITELKVNQWSSVIDETVMKAPQRVISTPKFHPTKSPHNLIEEDLFYNPWALLVSTIFLNKTSCKNARPYVFWFLEENPSPGAVLERNSGDLEKYFVKLGLQRTRATQVWRMSYDFLHKNWKNVGELYGIGHYGQDAFRMFCLGDFSVEPKDRFLRIYKAWYEMVDKKCRIFEMNT